MRHRFLVNVTNGFENPSKEILDNTGDLDFAFGGVAIAFMFKKERGFDFQVKKDYVIVGIEPTYQYDHLKILCIHKNKRESFIRHGVAWGPYGTEICARTKIYKDFKNKCKFTRFIDEWHPILFKESNEEK